MDEINRQAAIAGSTKKNSAAGGDDGEEPGDEMFPNASRSCSMPKWLQQLFSSAN